MLQPIVKAQSTYFKDSWTLKQELNKLVIPKNASILSFDAVPMYTSIDTEDCIKQLSEYLINPATLQQFKHFPLEALIEAIKIVMQNNRMRFGDIIVRQLVGIVMGMSPAPTLANLYVALHEEKEILPFLKTNLLYLHRFIDDGLAIWIHDADPSTDQRNWIAFKNSIKKEVSTGPSQNEVHA